MSMRVGLLAVAALLLAGCQDNSPPLAPTDQPADPTFSTAPAQTIPGRYIVVFRRSVKDADRDAVRIAGIHRGKLKHVYRSALKGMALDLPDAAVAALRADPSVAYVEADQIAHIVTEQAGATWGLDRADQRALPLTTTYSYFANGTGVRVYIIDTGINFGHAEFGGRAVTGIDQVSAGGSAADCNGHGTHVAGTVGGSQYGIAKSVSLYAVRVLDCAGSGSYSGVIAGVDWVTANHVGPSVANMSLGGGFSQALNDAVSASINSGVTYAVAAGNGNAFGIPQNACNSSPASTGPALTVGATNSSDQQASFSNYGNCVDIQAPGVGITSAWYTSATATNTISGTSMAAPHVAGAAALYLSTNGTATPAQVATALVSDATAGAVTGLQTGTANLLLYTGSIGSGGPPPPPPPPPTPPAAPTSLAATASGSAQINLVWTDNAGDETGFSVERCQGAGCTTFVQLATVGASVTDFSNTGLAAGTSYSYQVRASNAGGYSDYSNVASATTAATPPNSAPVARYTWSCNDRNCSFNGSSSTDDKAVTAYTWSFGDGSTGSGAVVSKRYSTRSTFNVRLTVRDAEGLTVARTCSVRVVRNSTRSGTCAP